MFQDGLRRATAAEGTAKILAESAVEKGQKRADADTHAALGDLFKQCARRGVEGVLGTS